MNLIWNANTSEKCLLRWQWIYNCWIRFYWVEWLTCTVDSSVDPALSTLGSGLSSPFSGSIWQKKCQINAACYSLSPQDLYRPSWPRNERVSWWWFLLFLPCPTLKWPPGLNVHEQWASYSLIPHSHPFSEALPSRYWPLTLIWILYKKKTHLHQTKSTHISHV